MTFRSFRRASSSGVASCLQERVEHFSQVLERIRSVITGAREYAWLIADEPIIVGRSPGESFISRDIPVRFIFEPRVDHRLLAAVTSALPRAQFATMSEIKVAMGINESGAGVIFPGPDGRIDFSAGFYGNNATFRSWCCDLFEHYWSRSRKMQPT